MRTVTALAAIALLVACMPLATTMPTTSVTRIERVEMSAKQGLLLASYAYVGAARSGAALIRAGAVDDATSARIVTLSNRVERALLRARATTDSVAVAVEVEAAMRDLADLIPLAQEAGR